MGSLSIGLQQLIEIARVLSSGARIIIHDEPTSALSPPEVERLFETLRRLKAQGRSFIFISHFLDDILRISDAVTIFRNGRKIVTTPVEGIDKLWVIERMIGSGHEELGETYTGEFKLRLRRSGAPAPEPAVPSAREAPVARSPAPSKPAKASKKKSIDDPSLIGVPSPLLGVFYRAPKPGEPPFIEVGRQVEE